MPQKIQPLFISGFRPLSKRPIRRSIKCSSTAASAAGIRVLTAAEGVGVRALLVHAKDEAAKAFYERYDFAPLPSYPMHLVLLLKDARRIVSR